MPTRKPVYLVSLRYGIKRPWLLRAVLYDMSDACVCARALANVHKFDEANQPAYPEVLLQERHGSGDDALFVNLFKYHPNADDPEIIESFSYMNESTGGM